MGRIAQTDLMPDFTGRSLDGGRYRLMEQLGAGAYGKVYRAMDLTGQPSPPKFYAVKCMNNPAPGTHAELLQRREFAHHKRVSGHPNIVTFHRTWEDGLQVYVVLDLCTGGDLFSAITEKRLFYKNNKLIKTAFVQLVSAVEHCHQIGVYHRDIKPENVLCSDDGSEIRLADFGLSTTSKISRDFGCGSSYYMSPECIGRPSSKGPGFRDYSTPENDIWALGVILTNMITGRNPWRFATSQDDCFSAFMTDRNFLKRALPISSGVNAILKKIFTSHPSRRIPLSTLKDEVLRLGAFYGDEEETIVKVERKLSVHDASRPTLQTYDSNSSNGSVDSSPDSEEDYIFISPDPNEVVTNQPPPKTETLPETSIAENTTLVGSDDNNSSNALPSTSSSSSSSESAGPITPETYPVVDDPCVDIPDISGEGLGLPANLTGVQPLQARKEVVTPRQKTRRPADILRSAVQRIKILSKADASS